MFRQKRCSSASLTAKVASINRFWSSIKRVSNHFHISNLQYARSASGDIDATVRLRPYDPVATGASKTLTQRLVCDPRRAIEEDRLAPSQLLQAWTLLRRAGGVQQNVCLRQPTWSTRVSALAGSDQWPEVMESFENEPVSSEQEDSDSEKSDLNKLMMAANPSGHGSRWRRNSLARRKRRFARASRA